jgi:hypothetical protein
MGHPEKTPRIIIRCMGVLMTASEANRQRVLALILLEDGPKLEQSSVTNKNSPTLLRGKPPMSEARQPWPSGRFDTPQSIAS